MPPLLPAPGQPPPDPAGLQVPAPLLLPLRRGQPHQVEAGPGHLPGGHLHLHLHQAPGHYLLPVCRVTGAGPCSAPPPPPPPPTPRPPSPPGASAAAAPAPACTLPSPRPCAGLTCEERGWKNICCSCKNIQGGVVPRQRRPDLALRLLPGDVRPLAGGHAGQAAEPTRQVARGGDGYG